MKKKLILIGAGLLALASLTGCKSTKTNVDQTLPEDDPTSTVEIKFWHCLGHDKTVNLNKIVDAFNAKYEGKYKVKLDHVAGDYDSLHDALKQKLAAGEIPALTMGYPDSFSEYISNDITESSILRLNNFINDEKFGYSEAELKDFVEAYYNEGTGYQFEGVWSMPMYKSTEVMYFNKQYFAGASDLNMAKFSGNSEFMAKYNLAVKATATDAQLADLSTWLSANGGYVYAIPERWDEMFTIAAQMKADRAASTEKDVREKEFYPVGYDSDANLLISQFKQRGIEYTVNDAESQAEPFKHFKFDNDEARGFVDEIIGYYNDKLLITKNTLGGTYTNTYFTEGKSPISIGSTGGSSYQTSINFSVGLSHVPYAKDKDGNDNPQYIQQGPSVCFFDNENPYIHKGAWLFYKELASPENNVKVALENSYDPVRVSSYETDTYKDWIAKAGKGLIYDIPNITKDLKEYYMTSPVFVGSGEARNQIGAIITYIARNKMSTQEAFETAIGYCRAAVS